MPYGWVDPDVALFHRGVTVWYTYRNDSMDECRREYWYTINETASEDDGRCEGVFDIRDLAAYVNVREHDDILQEAIDNHELPWWKFQTAGKSSPQPSGVARSRAEKEWEIE